MAHEPASGEDEIGREALRVRLETMYLLLTLELAAQDFKQLEKSNLLGLAWLRNRIRSEWWFVWGKCYLNSAFPVPLGFAV